MDFRRSLRHARQMSVEPKNNAGCCGYCLMVGAFCTVFVMVLVGLAIIGVGIAKLVMGGIYFHDCELEPLLPIFLIVDGCVAFGLGCKCNCGQTREDEGESVGTIAIKACVGLFQIAWLICGTIWVVNVRDIIYSPGYCSEIVASISAPVNGSVILSALTTEENPVVKCLTCAPALVDFVFGICIFQWVLVGLVLLTLCCTICKALNG